MASELNPFTIAKARIAKAAKALGLDAATTELLSTPQREVWVALPVKMDDGTTKIFHGVAFTTLPSKVSASNTTRRAVRPKAAFAGSRRKRSTRFARSRAG